MNKNIVIIDDDEDILEVVQYILVEEGYNVISYDHLAGLEKIAEQQPSVILLDNKLANIYSDILCLSLKANPITKAIPVILVSAIDDLEQVAKHCNADAFLAKPFDLKDLINLVKHYSEIYNNIV